MISRFGCGLSVAMSLALSFAAAERACGQAAPTGQFAAIYRGTATYTVTSYSTGMPLAQPMRFKFVDTFYFIQYNTRNDYTNNTGVGAIAPIADVTAPNNTTVAGDPAPTMNHYSLVYFTSGKHPFSAFNSGNPNGDFDLGYDCPFVGVNPPGSGPDLADLYHISMGPVSYLSNPPAPPPPAKPIQKGSTFMCLPLLNDTSTNDIGTVGNAAPDLIVDNRRTQSLALFGAVAGAAKPLAGAAPLSRQGNTRVFIVP